MESNSLNFLTVNMVSSISNTYLIQVQGNIYSVHGNGHVYCVMVQSGIKCVAPVTADNLP
jgi:hypothetical protein